MIPRSWWTIIARTHLFFFFFFLMAPFMPLPAPARRALRCFPRCRWPAGVTARRKSLTCSSSNEPARARH